MKSMYARTPKAPAKYNPGTGLRVKRAPASMKSASKRSNAKARYVGSKPATLRVKKAPAGMMRHPASHAKARRMDRTE